MLIADIVDPDATGAALVVRTRAALERALRSCLLEEEAEPQAIHRAMWYAVLNGSHRWRPLLMLLAAEAYSGREGDLLPTACAFELLRLSFLILDDPPCMDNAELRRDGPACHKVFGEAVAIMASIALLSLAHRLILDNSRAFGLPPATVYRLLQDVLGLTTSEGMIAGQFADLDSDGMPLNETSVAAVHHSKAGLLCVAAVKAGALLVGASDQELTYLNRYAAQFGLAYQIKDDLRDATADVDRLQTPASSNLRKTIFASFYGVLGAADRPRDAVEAALDALQPSRVGAAKLRQLFLWHSSHKMQRSYQGLGSGSTAGCGGCYGKGIIAETSPSCVSDDLVAPA